jgi:endonuclease YncB( thermonuclease family)
MLAGMSRLLVAASWSLLTLLACAGVPAETVAPQTLAAHVVKVSDGDSLEVRDSNGLVHRIRLGGIDAPEHDQPFGNRARQTLSRYVLDKDVRVEIQKRDAYGRFVAKVWVVSPDAPCAVPSCPKTLDVAQAQLASGMAWHYKKYQMEQTEEDRLRYAFEEYEARARKVGLWSDPHARPPDEWRAGLTDGDVKKSRAGICHTTDSQSYRSVRYFTSYATLEACLASGGRLPRG